MLAELPAMLTIDRVLDLIPNREASQYSRRFVCGGVSCDLVTNKDAVRQWCERYLPPFFDVDELAADSGPVVSAFYCPDLPALAQVVDFGVSPRPIALHLEKRGLCWQMNEDLLCIQEIQDGDFYFVAPVSEKVVYVTCRDSYDALRNPARLVREVISNKLALEGCLRLHASAVVYDHLAVPMMGEKRAGKTTLLVDGVVHRAGQYMSNDHLYVWAEESVRARGVPLSCMLGVGTMLSYDPLRIHLRDFDYFFERVRPATELWEGQVKLEFSPVEMASILNTTLRAEAEVRFFVLPCLDPAQPRISVRELDTREKAEALAGAMRGDSATFPNWFQMGHVGGDVLAPAMQETFERVVSLPFVEVAGGEVSQITAHICDHLLGQVV